MESGPIQKYMHENHAHTERTRVGAASVHERSQTRHANQQLRRRVDASKGSDRGEEEARLRLKGFLRLMSLSEMPRWALKSSPGCSHVCFTDEAAEPLHPAATAPLRGGPAVPH